MRHLASLSCATLLALGGGCNRGPEPKPFDPSQAAPAAEAPATAAPGLPPGHPPTAPSEAPAMPPGHPPVGGPGELAPGQAPSAAPTGAPTAGGLTWTAGAPLEARAPQSNMRAAEYIIAGGAPDAVLTVHFFPGMGGGVDANLDRWIGQFSNPDGTPLGRSAAKLDKRSVGGIAISTVDVAGNFAASMGPMMQADPSGPRPNYRMVGAVAEGPKGLVFFKLTGPASDVDRAKPAFDALLESLEPAG
jgi:hypothetical protein